MRRPQLLLVRHGATEWTAQRRHTGRTDVPLSDDGRDEARRVAEILAVERPDHVLTSPLRRARETAALAGFPDAEVDDGLIERDYGDLEGRTHADVAAERPGWDVWRGEVPGGEATAALGTRVDGLLERLLSLDGTVLLFAHGHTLRTLTARWLDLPPAFGGQLILRTATVSRLGWDRDVRILSEVNRDAPAGAVLPARYEATWPDDDRDAAFKRDVAERTRLDPLPTFRQLSANTGVPVGALVRYALVRWTSEGSDALLALGPDAVQRLASLVDEAERAPSDAARLARYERVAGYVRWLEAGR